MDLASLYKRYAPDVNRFALYLSGDRALAEDLTSETFVRLLLAKDRVELATVKGYLFTITRNLFLQGLRGEARRCELPSDVRDSAPRPDEAAQGRAELRAVLAALQELPEMDRAALLMRAQEGLAYEEIAAALGLSLAAVKVKIHRARLRLARHRSGKEKTP
jgi:RNA polymerase sigma-70 factor, ECF subfamily